MHRREKNIKVDLKKLFDGQINILKNNNNSNSFQFSIRNVKATEAASATLLNKPSFKAFNVTL